MMTGRAPQIRNSVLLAGAIFTLVLQTAALGGIVFKGAQWSEHVDFQQAITTAKDAKQDEILERIVNQLSALEARVHDLEPRKPCCPR